MKNPLRPASLSDADPRAKNRAGCLPAARGEADLAAVTMLEAIRQAMFEEMDRDPAVVAIGEDIGVYGGAFKVTEG